MSQTTRSRRCTGPWLALVAGGALAGGARAQELTDESFERWRDYVLPAEEEQGWLEVGWRQSYWEAIEEAHTSRKPILLWAMNGHPLGCT